jgi:hypothetical protein
VGAHAARQLRTGSAIYAKRSTGERDSHSIQIDFEFRYCADVALLKFA